MRNRSVLILAATSLAFTAVAIGLVASGEGRLPAMLVYLAGLGIGSGAIWRTSPRHDGDENEDHEPWIERQDLPLIAAAMLVQLLGLLYMQSFSFHYVQDEFITGYTSYTLPGLTEIEWFAGYPAPGEWIAGFPILYYALQWPFIELFGLTLETIRISTWPYHLLTATLVYLIGREFFQCRPWAIFVAMVYVLLAPNLYMAGYGMHNISSTFFFLAALYAAIRMIRNDSRGWVIVCGLFSSMAYLTYTSSYLTLPLIGVFVGLTALFQRNWQPLLRYGQVLILVTIGLSPFLTYALTGHNYFTERGDQVNAVSAIWESDEVRSPTSELAAHIWTNIESLYTPGIGGVTDYWFGHQSLFDWFTLALFVAGLGIAIVTGIRRRDELELTVVAVVLSTFIFGMLLTLPAGGFHRTTLAFPFVAILFGLTTRTLVERRPGLRDRPRLQMTGTIGILLVFILINISMLRTMTAEDERISGLTDSVPITGYIEDTLPEGEEVIVSAFPGYHLERELIVRTGDVYDIRIQPFDKAVEHGDDTLIILFQPSSDQTHRLEARYAQGEFVDEWEGYELDRHVIWDPH